MTLLRRFGLSQLQGLRHWAEMSGHVVVPFEALGFDRFCSDSGGKGSSERTPVIFPASSIMCTTETATRPVPKRAQSVH